MDGSDDFEFVEIESPNTNNNLSISTLYRPLASPTSFFDTNFILLCEHWLGLHDFSSFVLLGTILSEVNL